MAIYKGIVKGTQYSNRGTNVGKQRGVLYAGQSNTMQTHSSELITPLFVKDSTTKGEYERVRAIDPGDKFKFNKERFGKNSRPPKEAE